MEKLAGYVEHIIYRNADNGYTVLNLVSGEDEKEDPLDFVLWKPYKPGEPKWDSPWGVGYPGWHIECSCISLKYLGENLDIHCGGVDNIFPHHTNEIAQSESYIGHLWCKYWFHVEHLNDANGKMSKSKGEFLTVSLLESKGYNPLAYRMFCLQSHYRKQLLFSYDSLDGVSNAYNKLISKIKSISHDDSIVDEDIYLEYRNKFLECLNDDLNTSNALTVLYDVLKDDINNNTKLALVSEFDKVLSLDLLKNDDTVIDNEEYIKEMIEKRNTAKKNKDFALADSIRDELKDKGIILKDTREGTTYEVIK